MARARYLKPSFFTSKECDVKKQTAGQLLEPTPERDAESARRARIHARQRLTALERYVVEHGRELNVRGLMLLYVCIHAYRREVH